VRLTNHIPDGIIRVFKSPITHIYERETVN
jgi:hypothetical protein